MKIYFSGIGGSGAYYLAKYFLAKGDAVFGSDLYDGQRIQDLKTLGAVINAGEPDLNFIPIVDAYIYSPALPEAHPEREFFRHKKIVCWDVGEITMDLINKYLEGQMSQVETAAIKQSHLIPLTDIDWNKKHYTAVTGTDGKTTTVSMICYLLKQEGKSVAALTTVGFKVNDALVETGLHTTSPSAQDLFKLLQMPELESVDHIILEVTSHALSMGRVAGAKFDTAVITNITSDHLDYHLTHENYFNAKASLLTKHLKTGGKAVLNDEDKSFPALKSVCVQYGVPFLTTSNFEGEITLPEFMNTPYNRINAKLSGMAIGVTNVDLSSFVGVKGRMEIIQTSPFEVIVDFAHTEDALSKVLKFLREKLDHTQRGGKLRVVFGCAGMRDKQKRPGMGKAAASFADEIYICPEDPRTEKLQDINRMILSGMGITLSEDFDGQVYIEMMTNQKKPVRVFQTGMIDDRKKAIESALTHAGAGDIVVVCGKGHEQSMCFGTEEQEWSDQEEIRKLLQK